MSTSCIPSDSDRICAARYLSYKTGFQWTPSHLGISMSKTVQNETHEYTINFLKQFIQHGVRTFTDMSSPLDANRVHLAICNSHPQEIQRLAQLSYTDLGLEPNVLETLAHTKRQRDLAITVATIATGAAILSAGTLAKERCSMQ